MKPQVMFSGIALLYACAVMGAGGEDVKVIGERVNLRARPIADSEVVAQAGQGDVLTVIRSESDWLAVQAPTNAGVWLKADLVKDGVVLSDRLNVRCGPGLSYRDVGGVRKGDRVVISETRGEWLRILPPEGVVVWVSRRLVAPANEGPAVLVDRVTTGAVTGVVAEGDAPPAPMHDGSSAKLPDGVTQDRLAPVLGQGAVITRQGVVERVPLAFVRGVEFRLVDRENGRKATTCYLRGDERQVLALMGRRCTVTGRGYWLNGERVPLIYVDSLIAAYSP